MEIVKRVFAYLRVSGRGQLEGDGFDRQTEVIQDYCEKNKLFVVRTFREEAVSGTVEAIDRPELSRAMGMCGGALGVDTIIVERADRLARDSFVSELFFREARKLGIKVIEAASGTVLSTEDDSDPTKIMIRQMLGVMAQWEKSMVVRKLRMARDRIRQETGKCEGPKIKPVPAKVMPFWDELVDRHQNRGESIVSLCRWLNRKTKTHWPKSTVYYWLRKPTFILRKEQHAITHINRENELAKRALQVATTGEGYEQSNWTPEGPREGEVEVDDYYEQEG